MRPLALAERRQVGRRLALLAAPYGIQCRAEQPLQLGVPLEAALRVAHQLHRRALDHAGPALTSDQVGGQSQRARQGQRQHGATSPQQGAPARLTVGWAIEHGRKLLTPVGRNAK